MMYFRCMAQIAGVTFALSCSSVMAQSLAYCPAKSEAEARTVLGLGDMQDVNIDSLLASLEADMSYERKHADNKPGCKGAVTLEEPISYMIFAGMDPTNRYFRTYLVVADQTGLVRYVDERHQHEPPKLFP
ncbi:MAG: hypothetical protein MnENMB40S_21710 [Rhizobiaceae bacterium MnEN-MB40S]|nr:MAG: hypothetical protein MnENMB40S_21710 [Rhizobiaceae bacterium MnEN-MB40S]